MAAFKTNATLIHGISLLSLYSSGKWRFKTPVDLPIYLPITMQALCICDNMILLLLTVSTFLKPVCVYHPKLNPTDQWMDQSRGLTSLQQRQINVLDMWDKHCRIKVEDKNWFKTSSLSISKEKHIFLHIPHTYCLSIAIRSSLPFFSLPYVAS